jgi:hypothetical protein
VIIPLFRWFLNHNQPVCEAGIAIVYLALAILSWRHPAHSIAYAAASALAITLATCAALAQ